MQLENIREAFLWEEENQQEGEIVKAGTEKWHKGRVIREEKKVA